MSETHDAPEITPEIAGSDWIDELTDSQCMEIFWLYVDPPEPFLERFPPELLGAAMRQVLHRIAAGAPVVSPEPGEGR